MIVELNRTCGLDLKLDTDKPGLIFGKDLKFSQPVVRRLSQMREVFLDKDIQKPEELYYMYRDVHCFSDAPFLERNKLRYDVTVIKPDYLGGELMKTAGHYHANNFGELYEVVYGECLCLLQRPDSQDYRVIEEVILVEARAGQKIVIPPGFGHILINPGPDYLVTSNWVSSCFNSEYELYKRMQGGAYFTIISDGKLEFRKNPHFKQVVSIRFVKPTRRIDRFGLLEASPIYPLINQDVRKLDFLNHPLDYDYGDVFIK